MAAKVDQCGTFVGQLEFYAPNITGLFASTVLEIFNRHFAEDGSLVACQGGEIQIRIAVRPYPHVILHVGEADLGEFGDNSVGRHFEPGGQLFLR